MPFQLEWLVQHRVILMRVWGAVTADEIARQDAALALLLDEGSAPVHVFADDRKVSGAPRNPNEAWKAVRNVASHPAMGWMIAIGDTHPIARFLTQSFMRGFGISFQRFANIHEALNFLHKQDQTFQREQVDVSKFD